LKKIKLSVHSIATPLVARVRFVSLLFALANASSDLCLVSDAPYIQNRPLAGCGPDGFLDFGTL